MFKNSSLSKNGAKSSIGLVAKLPSDFLYTEAFGNVLCSGSTINSHIIGPVVFNIFYKSFFRFCWLDIFIYGILYAAAFNSIEGSVSPLDGSLTTKLPPKWVFWVVLIDPYPLLFNIKNLIGNW